MAKSPKSRKAAPRGPSFAGVALRTVGVRVGVAVALVGVAAGLYAYRERGAPVVTQDAHPIVVASPKPAPTVSPSPAPTEAEAPEPPRREESHKPMSASLHAAFDTWLMTAYAKCWRAPKTLPDGDPYLPKVRVAFKEDGGLAGPPHLVNPPSDPAWKPHAEAALKAVKGCDPLHVPDKYADYYPSWKSKTVYFDPTRN